MDQVPVNPEGSTPGGKGLSQLFDLLSTGERPGRRIDNHKPIMVQRGRTVKHPVVYVIAQT